MPNLELQNLLNFPAGRKPKDRVLTGFRLIDFEEVKRRAKDTDNFRYCISNKRPKRFRREADIMILNYLPEEPTKELNDFPSNKLRAKHNLPPNSAIMKKRLVGEDAVYAAELQLVAKVDAKGNPILDKEGNPVPFYGNIELTSKLLHKAIVSWTFCDRSTEEVYPITEETVGSLMKEDFEYLMNEFMAVMTALREERAGGDESSETTPAASLTEPEKNASSTSSTDESEPSENTVKEDSE
jgi:hypothetical protein